MEEQTATQRVFTISEVNALIPALSTLVQDQLREQSEIEHGLAELMRLTGAPPRSLRPSEADSAEVARRKGDLRGRISRYETGWQRVQKWGGVIKDPQTGLVDFYGRVDGKLVWLCWQYGEPAVAHWHPLDQGFPSRKPLERVLVPRTMN